VKEEHTSSSVQKLGRCEQQGEVLRLGFPLKKWIPTPYWFRLLALLRKWKKNDDRQLAFGFTKTLRAGKAFRKVR